MVGTFMYWCFSGVLTSLIAIQIEEPPLTSLGDLNAMSDFKLFVFGKGSTHASILKWAKNDTRQWNSYEHFIMPNLWMNDSITESEFLAAKNPGVGVILEDFSINLEINNCRA